MAENKTKATRQSVHQFLNSVEDKQKRADAKFLLKLMREITGDKPVMWGTSIVGFGTYRYKYASGREGEFMVTGFSPRKRNLTVYIMPGYRDYEDLLNRLGKHKIGKSCLYINKLADVDVDVLSELISQAVQYMREKYEVS